MPQHTLPDDIQPWWRGIAEKLPVHALKQMRHLPEDERARIPAEMLAGMFLPFLEAEPEEAFLDSSLYVPELQRIVEPMMASFWHAKLDEAPAEALHLATKMGPPRRARVGIPLEAVERAWERTAQEKPYVALSALRHLPELEPLLSQEQITEAFRSAVRAHGTSGLASLELLPEGYVRGIPRELLADAWDMAKRSIHDHGFEHGAGWLWEKVTKLPDEALQAAGEGKVAQAWSDYAQLGLSNAIQELRAGRNRRIPSAWVQQAVAPSVAEAWAAYTKKGAKDTLELLTRAGEAVWAHLKPEQVAYAWRRRAKQDSYAAVSWLAQAPLELALKVPGADLALLLQLDSSLQNMTRTLARLPALLHQKLPPAEVAATVRRLSQTRAGRSEALRLVEMLPDDALSGLKRADLAQLLQDGTPEQRTRAITLLHRFPAYATQAPVPEPKRALRTR
jgi:hypothetical protein